MSQLLKIVLIDSLCAGAKAELVMSGNTSLNGTNGIGKSSFLKLIPVFYGATPGRVIRAGANKQSFANWYLPNASSFIVFEYTNSEGQPRCAVMHRSGESYSYRLVSSAWKPELLYIDPAAGLLVSAAELQGHILRIGVDCSPELQPMHYRRIIQYNTGNANLDGVDDLSRRKMIQTLRPSFSLAPKRKDFGGIDNVTMAMLESGHTFEGIKSTMTEILQQDNDDPSQALQSISGHAFRSLIDNHAGLQIYERELKGRISELDTLREQYESGTRQLANHKQRALLMIEDLRSGQQRNSEAIADVTREASEYEETTLKQRDALATERGTIASDLREAELQVKRIEDQRAQYERDGLEDLLELDARSEELLAQRNQKQQHLSQLNQQGIDIRLLHEQRTQAAKDSATDLREKTRSRTDADSRALLARKEAHDRYYSALIEDTRDNQRIEMDEVQARQQAGVAEHSRQQAELRLLQSLTVLPDAQAELNAAQAAITEQRAVCDEHKAACKALEVEDKQLHEAQAVLAASYQGAERRRENLKQNQDELVAQLNASNDTLLGFLRKNHPSWTDNIARLVPPRVLMRTDLNPSLHTSLVNGEGNSTGADLTLYGVELTLSPLSAPSFASDEDIKAEIASLTDQIQACDSELDSLKKQHSAFEDRKRQLRQRESKATQALSQAEAELASRSDLLTGIHERARAQYLEQLEIQVCRTNEAAERLKQIEEEIHTLRGDHGRHLLELRTTGELAGKEILEEHEQLLESSRLAIQRIDEQLKKELDQLEADKATQLRAAGIDDSVNRRLEAEIAALGRQIKRWTDHRSIIESYRLWKANVLPELGNRQAELIRCEGERDRINRAIEEFERARQAVIAERNIRRKALIEEGNALAEQMTISQRIVGQLNNVDANPEAGRLQNQKAEDIEAQVSALRAEREGIHKRARATYHEVTTRYSRGSLQQTPHGGEIDQIAAQARQAAEDYELAWLHASKGLREHMDNFHHEQRGKMIMQAQSLAIKLCDSSDKLDILHKSILTLGRHATARAQAVLGSFPPIQKFEFRVTSRIHNLSFWADLANFETQYRRWHEMGDGFEPTALFMDAVHRIERQIREGAFGTDISKCFDVSVACVDQGHLKVANNNQDLVNISSDGLTKIIVSMVFVSLFELLRKDANFQMVIPLDEALELSPENYIALVDLFNQRGVSMLAAFPGGAPELLKQFPNCYTLKRRATGKGIEVREYLNDEIDPLDDLNAALAEEMETLA